MKVWILVAGFICAAGLVYAGNQDNVKTIELPVVRIELKAGDGRDKAETLCNICHSLDYITTQPAFTRNQWGATVNKMIKVMGAPVKEEDAKTIVDYLVRAYGHGD